MALPPEPLEELLPRARTVVLAVVDRVETLGAVPPEDRGRPLDASADRPPQRVHLRVVRTLLGRPGAAVVALKPTAGYMLRAGNQGPFLLDGGSPEPGILGRHGPDTYRVDVLEAALALRRT